MRTIGIAALVVAAVALSAEVWIDDTGGVRVRRSDLHEAVCWALKDHDFPIACPQPDVQLDGNLDKAAEAP